MGIIYKLKPEIIALILEQKRTNPTISCRRLVSSVKVKFGITISKSSINSMFKGAGLSMPVGRRAENVNVVSKSRIPGLLAVEMGKAGIIEPPKKEAPPQEPALLSGPVPEKQAYLPQLVVPQEVKQPEKVTEIEPELVPEKVAAVPLENIEPPKKEELLQEMPSVCEPEFGNPQPLLQSVVPQEVKPIKDFDGETTGAVILKAADSLLGGIAQINKIVRLYLKSSDIEFQDKTEGLFFASFFDKYPFSNLKPDSGLWPLIGQCFSPEELVSYHHELQEFRLLPGQILQALPELFPVVRGIKADLSDGRVLYFDGDLHTVWSTPYIPSDFSTTLCGTTVSINRSILNENPLIFFMAPGMDFPGNELFDFLTCMQNPEVNEITQLSLYGWEFKELKVIKIEASLKQQFIFGFWSWQFVQYRKVVALGEFKPLQGFPLNKEFFIASIEIEITQQSANKGVRLKGFAIKTSQNSKINLLIFGNLTDQGKILEQSVIDYLYRWPNLEETFQDFSRKMEMSIYAASSEPTYQLDISLNRELAMDIKVPFERYLQVLDAYVRRSLFPAGYENKDLSTMKENFYGLKVVLKEEPGYCSAIFQVPAQYQFRSALAYVCCRLNEKEISFVPGLKLWFFVSA